MRPLLDESLPRLLARELPGHEVATVPSLGWAGTANGRLLERAAKEGFEAFLTVDRGFEFEQNVERFPLTVVILLARGNRLEDLRPLIPDLMETLKVASGPKLRKVGG